MSDVRNRSAMDPHGAELVKRLPGARLAYRRPSLSVYGSVRELTGSVSGIDVGDGSTMMN